MHIHDTSDETYTRDTNFEERIGTLLGRRYLGKRCFNDHIRDDDGSVLLYITEERLNPTIFLEEKQWFEVIMVSAGCRLLAQNLLSDNIVYMQWPLWGDGIHYIGDNLWIVEEQLLEGDNPAITPAIITNPKVG